MSSSVHTTNRKRPIIISGPSGAGKSTLLKKLFATYPDTFSFSVSHTTRSPRTGEVNGREYNFIPRETFESHISSGNFFIEHAQFGGNLYGTSIGAVKRVDEEGGKWCVLDIEMEGVKQMARHGELGIDVRDVGRVGRFLFLAPPGLKVLEERLRGRGTDKEEDIRKRLNQAERELAFAESEEGKKIFERVVVNDDLEKAWEEVRNWVLEDGELRASIRERGLENIEG